MSTNGEREKGYENAYNKLEAEKSAAVEQYAPGCEPKYC
jgi:hypothetical protein